MPTPQVSPMTWRSTGTVCGEASEWVLSSSGIFLAEMIVMARFTVVTYLDRIERLECRFKNYVLILNPLNKKFPESEQPYSLVNHACRHSFVVSTSPSEVTSKVRAKPACNKINRVISPPVRDAVCWYICKRLPFKYLCWIREGYWFAGMSFRAGGMGFWFWL